jgi:hypothetical protein
VVLRTSVWVRMPGAGFAKSNGISYSFGPAIPRNRRRIAHTNCFRTSDVRQDRPTANDPRTFLLAKGGHAGNDYSIDTGIVTTLFPAACGNRRLARNVTISLINCEGSGACGPVRHTRSVNGTALATLPSDATVIRTQTHPLKGVPRDLILDRM